MRIDYFHKEPQLTRDTIRIGELFDGKVLRAHLDETTYDSDEKSMEKSA